MPNIQSLPFDESVFIIFSDLRDDDDTRFENILMEIGQCVGTIIQFNTFDLITDSLHIY